MASEMGNNSNSDTKHDRKKKRKEFICTPNINKFVIIFKLIIFNKFIL